MPKPAFYETDAPEDETPESLQSRSDKKRSRRVQEESLAQLAKELVDLNERQLERLALPELVLDAVLDARRIPSPAAKNRQMRVVRTALRDSNWGVIRVRVTELLASGAVHVEAASPDPERPGIEAEWVVRLLGEGSLALERLVAEHPSADRTHLRQLVKAVHRATADRRHKAEQKLLDAVRSLLHHSAR